MSTFSADPTVLHTPKWRSQIPMQPCIDPYESRIHLCCHSVCTFQVLCPNRRSKSVLCTIGYLDGSSSVSKGCTTTTGPNTSSIEILQDVSTSTITVGRHAASSVGISGIVHHKEPSTIFNRRLNKAHHLLLVFVGMSEPKSLLLCCGSPTVRS